MITLGTDLLVKRDHPLPVRSIQSGGDFRKTDGQLPIKAVDATRVLGAMRQKRWTPASGLGDQGGLPRGSSPRALCFGVRLERLSLAWENTLSLGSQKGPRMWPGERDGDCLYAPGIKEGVGGLAFLCFAMTQTRSGTRGTFGSPLQRFS